VLQKWGMTCGSLHCFVSDRQSLGVLQMEVISQRSEQADNVTIRTVCEVKEEIPF
jgi:hypothetical protein